MIILRGSDRRCRSLMRGYDDRACRIAWSAVRLDRCGERTGPAIPAFLALAVATLTAEDIRDSRRTAGHEDAAGTASVTDAARG